MARILFVLFVIFTSCKTHVTHEILHETYRVETLQGNKLQDFEFTLSFNKKENSVFGKAGCNRYFGSFKQTKTQINFSQMASTEMYCNNDTLMQFESQFLKTLSKIIKVEVHTSTMLLKENDVILITLRAQE